MTLLWIANLVLLAVVAPVILLFAGRIVRRLRAIATLVDDTLRHAKGLSTQLEAVPKLVETKQLTGAARGIVGRYGRAVLQLL